MKDIFKIYESMKTDKHNEIILQYNSSGFNIVSV